MWLAVMKLIKVVIEVKSDAGKNVMIERCEPLAALTKRACGREEARVALIAAVMLVFAESGVIVEIKGW